MKLIISFIIILFSSSFAYGQQDSIKNTIAIFFDGISKLSDKLLRENITPDFLLLEDGEVWNIDTLINKIQPLKEMNYKRTNNFKYIAIEISGDWAWASYHNSADVMVNNKPGKRNWLETALLARQDGIWKIKVMHSTFIHE